MKKFNKKVIVSVVLSVVLLVCAGLTVKSILAGNTSNNNETAIKIEDKASILKQLYDNGEDLELLSIVPYKEMITLDVMCLDQDFLDLIENRAENLYEKGDKDGNVATLRNGVANPHTFTITKSDNNYTINYTNYFIESIFPVPTSGKDIYKVYRDYFSKHVKVRTVAASQLTDSDIDGADMIFIFGKPDRSNVITGMYNYLHSNMSADKLSPYNVDSSVDGLYKEDQNGNFYKVTDENSGYYDTFYKNSYGEYESNDISWDMALKVIKYSYTKSIEDTPEKYYERVPVIVESSGLDSNSNIWKMSLIISNCTGLKADGTKDIYYYRDILNGLKLEAEQDTSANSEITSDQTVKYSNKIIKFNNTVQINKTSSGINVIASNEGQTSRDQQIITAGGYIKVQTINTKNYLYMYDSNNILVKRFEVSYPNKQLEVEYSTSNGSKINISVENNDKYTTPAGHIITPAYYNGSYTTNWGKTQSDYLLDVRNQDIKNHVYTNDSGSNGVFLMGVENFAISGDCILSAQVRDIPASEMNNGLSWYFRYLLGADPTDFMYSKNLNVLEIEPCQDFLYDYANSLNKETTRKNIYNFAYNVNFINYKKFDTVYNYEAYIKNSSSPQITFTCVTTAQFNGMNEDLIAKYDIIVMGSQTGMMNKSNNKTIYNDSSLDGYVYLAYGDLCKVNYTLLGSLTSDYISVDAQINGSDYKKISSDTGDMTTVWNYNNKVIFSKNLKSLWSPAIYNGLKNKSGNYFVVRNPATELSGINNVDNYYANSLGNVRFSDNDITEYKMNELINYARSGQPVVLSDDVFSCTTKDNGGIVYPTSHVYSFVSQMQNYSNVIPMNLASSNLMGLISEKNLEITSYGMYYDNNGDGINDIPVPECSYDSKGLLKSSCIIKDTTSFTYRATIATKPGESYHLKLIVDKNADGKYNENVSTDDKNEVYYIKNFTADSLSTEVKFDITLPDGYNGLLSWRILVTNDNTVAGKLERTSVDGYTAVSGEKKVIKVLQILPINKITLNMKTNKTFSSLLNTAAEDINYNIIVDTIYASEYEDFFKHNPYDTQLDYDTENNYLKTNGYTMVVIGFADGYAYDNISNDYGAVDCLMDFMNKGNSILFTHDTVSYINNVNYSILKNGNKIEYNNYYNANWAKNWSTWCVDFSRIFRDYVGMDRYNITGITNLNSSKELEDANVPKNIQGNYITEIQGYNNIQIYRDALCKKNTNYRLSNNLYTLTSIKSYVNLDINNFDKTFLTKTVDELNEGQITQYPYYTTNSDGTLSVAPTHAQWYQLDMEDPDIVVWYTLGGKNNTYYGDDSKNAGINYYIYSKGNITYSGAGHSSDTDVESNKKELQLFVNTIVKAAVAGNFVPHVKITNAASLKNANEYVLYPNSLDNDIEVKFVAKDEDLASREIVENSYSTEAEILNHIGKFNSGVVYWIDSTGAKKALINYSHDQSNYILNGEETIFKIYDPFADAADVTVAYNSASETDKNMYDCYQAYMTEGSVNISLEVRDIYGETGYSNLKIVEHQLFDLD